MSDSKPRVTLKTIANACGYSVNTVSRALRGDSKLPPQTIEKIRAVAEEHGYIRNRLAACMRSGRSNIIAIIVDNIHNQHYSSMITYLDSILKQKGYDIFILCYNADDDIEMNLINIAVSNVVDGVLFFPRSNSTNSVKPLIDNHIPFVLIDREIPDIEADVVCGDDYTGGYLAGDELCRLGHHRFLYLAGPFDVKSQKLRETGFFDALAAHGIPSDNVRIVSAQDTENALFSDSLIDLLLPVDYSAVFVYKDQTAYAALNAYHKAGLRIPEDLSIIGYDHLRQDIPFLPPLTSIGCISNYQMTEKIVEVLLDRITNPTCPRQEAVFPVQLFDGGTTSKYS